MIPKAAIGACLLAMAASWGTVGADELEDVIANYGRTVAASGTVSFSYTGDVAQRSASTKFAGNVMYSTKLLIRADSTISGASQGRHLLRCDGSILWEVVETGDTPTYVGKANMVLLRKHYAKAFTLFSIARNPCLQVSLLASVPLLVSMYDLTYETTYKVGDKDTLAFTGKINPDALRRSLSRGANRMSMSLSLLQRTAEKIWFYFGKDDGLLYQLQAVRRGHGLYLTVTFDDYKVMDSVAGMAVRYTPPPGAEVTDIVEDMMEGIEEYRARMARIPLKAGDVADAVSLRTINRYELPMASFKNAVLVLVWDNAAMGGPVEARELKRLSAIFGRMVEKPVYMILLTNRRGANMSDLQEGLSPFTFPIVVASNIEHNETVTALRLLDVRSRALVLEPGLKVKAVVPCSNAKWVDYTRKAAAEALAKIKG